MVYSPYKNEISQTIGLFLCLITAIVSILVLAGWAFDIQALKSVFPGFVTMKVNTAIAMLLCSISISLLFSDKFDHIANLFVIIFSLIAIAISVLTLSEDFLGWDLGIDQLIFKDMGGEGSIIPGRMGAASAYCFILLGIAAILASTTISLRLPVIITSSITTLIISGLTILSHLLLLIFNVQFWDNGGMAIHTAAGCILLGLALIILIKKEYIFNWSLDNLTTAVFIIGIVMLLGTATESYYFTSLSEKNIKSVTDTQIVLTELNEVFNEISELEGDQRGYILLGEEELIADRAKLKTNLQEYLENLSKLMNKDIKQKPNIEQLRNLVTQLIEFEDQVIMLRKQQGFDAAKLMMGSNQGIILLNNIGLLIKNIIQEQENIRQQEHFKAKDTSARTFLLLPLQVFFSLTILTFGLFLLNNVVTLRRQVEEQLRQSQKMDAIGQLTGGIAHDFNNLLGVIIGNLDLLEPLVTGNATAINRVHTIQKAANRGADLTKRLLAFSRLQQLNPTPTLLENSINNTIEMAKRGFGPEIKFVTHIEESIPPVLVDAAGLETALLNLVVNSRDAMPNGGTITINAKISELDKHYLLMHARELKPGRFARISISDTGHGMSDEIKSKAFEPFFTTKAHGKGTGLGLSMVFGFVKQSGGLIRIYSEVDHGTTVSIYLPLAQNAFVSAVSGRVKKDVKNKVSGIVLAVDDEVDLLEIAINFLEDMGYQVLHAMDGNSALVILERERHIDLLLTDVIMPGGMNGVELSAKALKLHPEIKIIYSSGFPSEALAEKSGTQINAPLLNKPYHRKDFIETVLSVMEQSK